MAEDPSMAIFRNFESQITKYQTQADAETDKLTNVNDDKINEATKACIATLSDILNQLDGTRKSIENSSVPEDYRSRLNKQANEKQNAITAMISNLMETLK
jgi:hypothetical protein